MADSVEKFACWPGWMPRARADSFQYEVVDRTVGSDLKGSKVRVEFPEDECTLTCEVSLCSGIQIAFFETWERDCLRQGCRWFLFHVLSGGELQYSLVRMKSRPKLSKFEGVSKATISLELVMKKRDI